MIHPDDPSREELSCSSESSGDDGEEEESEEDEEGEVDDEEEMPSPVTTTLLERQQRDSKDSTSSAEYRSEAESEPMPKKPKPASKRLPEGTKNNKEKKSREDQKKPRLWTKKDEIRLLKRILYFTKNIGHPSCDKPGLLAFLKKYMNAKFTWNQLLGKIKRLRSKFRAIAIKGEEPTTSQSHHKRIVYEISKRIWKDDIGGGEESQGSRDSTAAVAHEKMIRLKASKKLALLLEEKRRKLEMMEFELYVKRAELMKRQTQLILQTFNKSSSS